MKDWTVCPLADVVTGVQTGTTPSTKEPAYFNGNVDWYTPADIGNSKDLLSASRRITAKAVEEGKAKMVQPGALLVTCIGEIGRVGILRQESSSNQQITALTFNDEIDIDFAYYWFLYNKGHIERNANKSLVSILNNERLLDCCFFYPPIAQQKNIVKALDQADRIRRLRRYALEMSDAFLPAVFVEMFGNPAINPKDLPMEQIDDLTGLVSSGSTPLGGASVYLKTGVMFIRSQNVLMTKLDLSDVVFISQETHERMDRTHVQKGDVFLNITGASIGRVAVFDLSCDANVNQHVCIIRINVKKVLPKFLAYQLSIPSYQLAILANESGATRQAFTFDQIKQFRVLVPSMDMQKKFVEIVERHERLCATQAESLRQAEHLFQSLLHQAFSEN